MRAKESPEVRLARYTKDITNPRAWADRGYDLLEAARLLRPLVLEYWEAFDAFTQGHKPIQLPARNPHGIYFMLVAFALENFLKAHLVSIKAPAIETAVAHAPVLPKVLKDHDLVRLAGNVGLRLSEADKALVIRLSKSAVWCGRYPLPVKPQGLTHVIHYSRKDLDAIEKIVSRASQGLPPPAT
jgi:hypothetical protein